MSADCSTLINGKPGERVSVHDRGFQYGDGVFETLAVQNGVALLWDRHVRRLRRGASRLGFDAPPEPLLREEAARVCDGIKHAVLKIILTRGVIGRGYAVSGNSDPTRVLSRLPWPDYSSTSAVQGVNVRLCRMRLAHNPVLAGIKHLNRLEQVLGRAEWGSEFAEGLMLDVEGQLIEGTMSNVFLVKDGMLRTPDLSRCGVEGVMRETVLDKAREMKLSCDIASLVHDDVMQAEEMFLTNSLIGLWPVKTYDWTVAGGGHKDYRVGQITQTLQEAIQA